MIISNQLKQLETKDLAERRHHKIIFKTVDCR